MAYYSNEASLKATYGDTEASGLLIDAPGLPSAARLEKAAATAMAEIDSYLYSANYIVPLNFTEFGVTPVLPDVPIPLDASIQAISDCFTAFHLASSADLARKKYEDCRAAGIAWLERVLKGDLVLQITNVDPLAGPGNIVTIARPAVFNRYQLTEREIFPGWERNGY